MTFCTGPGSAMITLIIPGKKSETTHEKLQAQDFYFIILLHIMAFSFEKALWPWYGLRACGMAWSEPAFSYFSKEKIRIIILITTFCLLWITQCLGNDNHDDAGFWEDMCQVETGGTPAV